ncbi:ribosome small subunit-dependent GTPase A [Sphingobacteriales bacterium UPWRP_1]|nr:ribosome small subunit-dependent GTPase A [Sphingobacteriales bacterium TSM_CSM]PSJ76072.1 ribosome small subunit-dependent GTPase A [Sphingobacteriales bacterium UPWRP_1]
MQGIVLQSTGSWYKVLLPESGTETECRIKGKFRQDELGSTNPIAVGDHVEIEMEAGLNTGTIIDILPRKNYIIRQSPRKKWQKHIIAANIDQAVLMVTFSEPRTSFGFIDRFLITAEMFHIPALILFNKYDVYTPKDRALCAEATHTYQNLGYKCLTVSAVTGHGVEEVKSAMKNKTNLISGHSGVGKSTLINLLMPELDLDTRQISKFSGKGMHTTTFACMYALPFGGFIIDTPGIKEFGVVHLEPEEVSHYFCEMRQLLPHCKYNNCLHRDENQCAVKKAFEDGLIAESRYNSYLRILSDIEGINYWERS